ncbi:MAG: hypothetical protein ABIR68_14395 [Ilumatobacteraceae bacterium]
MAEFDVTGLDTQGFVVAQGFLTADDLAVLREDYAAAPLNPNFNYPLRTPSPAALGRLQQRIDSVVALVNEHTSSCVDMHASANYFATGVATGIDFAWHQDHESWFMVQDHHDYLNFYLPVVKPDVARSNLSVVPFDALRRAAPRAHEMLIDGGASHVQWIGGRCVAVSDDGGAIRVVPGGFDALAETPPLEAGDLLLLRGDVVHRTQDTSTARVALSVRVANSAAIVKRGRLAAGGVRKALMMSRNAIVYQMAFQAFDEAGTDQLAVGELDRRLQSMSPPVALRRRDFLRQLAGEKRRAHALSSFARDLPMAAVLAGVTRAQTLLASRRSTVTA